MEKEKVYSSPYEFEGKIPLKQAIPLGLQHVLAMFVGNLTPILIISGACGGELDAVKVSLLQNAMLVAGLVTLVQLFAIGPCGGKVPIIMGTSSGFIGVFNSVVNVMGGGLLAYGAIMGASIIGGLFEGVLGFMLKPLRRFFPVPVLKESRRKTSEAFPLPPPTNRLPQTTHNPAQCCQWCGMRRYNTNHVFHPKCLFPLHKEFRHSTHTLRKVRLPDDMLFLNIHGWPLLPVQKRLCPLRMPI